MAKKLYRVSEDKKLGGVCTGLGRYFDIDPVIFRIIFLVLLFLGGFGLLLYLIFFVAMPKDFK